MKGKAFSVLADFGLYFVLLALVAISAIMSPLFFTYNNIANLLTQSSFVGLLALGMTFVILVGGIDLSVGSVVGFSSILYATIMHGNFFTWMPKEIFIYKGAPVLTPILPFPLDILFVLLIGAIIGLASGALAYRFRIHSFIITLCVMIFTRGLAVSYTNGQPLFGVPDPLTFLAQGHAAQIPMPTIIWIGASILGLLFLRFLRFGRNIYAVGGNEEVARLSGIQPAMYRIFPFVASAFLAALVGILMSGRMGAGDPKIGQGWELDAIAAVVIGGASLSGGKGSAAGTVVGVLIMALIINIMNLLKIEAYPQQMAKGVIIIAALALQSLISRRKRI
jgi:ribose transport system permease protein